MSDRRDGLLPRRHPSAVQSRASTRQMSFCDTSHFEQGICLRCPGRREWPKVSWACFRLRPRLCSAGASLLSFCSPRSVRVARSGMSSRGLSFTSRQNTGCATSRSRRPHHALNPDLVSLRSIRSGRWTKSSTSKPSASSSVIPIASRPRNHDQGWLNREVYALIWSVSSAWSQGRRLRCLFPAAAPGDDASAPPLIVSVTSCDRSTSSPPTTSRARSRFLKLRSASGNLDFQEWRAR